MSSRPLSGLEQALLERLARDRGRPVSRRSLLVDVWGYAPDSRSRAVATTVARLRKHLEADPSTAETLLTVHGEGYMLAPHPTPSTPCLGRDAELRAILTWLDQPGGGWLHLIGGGGVGKTALLDHAVAHIRSERGHTLPGGIRDLRGVPPAELLDRLQAAPSSGGLTILDLQDHVPDRPDGWVEHLTTSPGRALLASRRAFDARGEAVLPIGLVARGPELHLPLALRLRLADPEAPDLEAARDPSAPPRHQSLAANRASTLASLPGGLPSGPPAPSTLREWSRAGLVTWSADGSPTLPAWLFGPSP